MDEIYNRLINLLLFDISPNDYTALFFQGIDHLFFQLRINVLLKTAIFLYGPCLIFYTADLIPLIHGRLFDLTKKPFPKIPKLCGDRLIYCNTPAKDCDERLENDRLFVPNSPSIQ